MLQQLFILLLGLLSQFTPLEIEGDRFFYSSEKECAELVVLGKADEWLESLPDALQVELNSTPKLKALFENATNVNRDKLKKVWDLIEDEGIELASSKKVAEYNHLVNKIDDIENAGGFAAWRNIPQTNQFGHIMPWEKMLYKERQAFKHSYGRHKTELELPNFQESNASYYQNLFNAKVTEIRNAGANSFFNAREFADGVMTNVKRTEPVIDGKKYFYYETINQKFISAGLME